MKKSTTYTFGYIYIAFISILACSCDFLELDPPKSKIPREVVFYDDLTATAAVTGIYNEMLSLTSFGSGTNQSITALAGVSSDELQDISNFFPENLEFANNDLTINNQWLLSLWESMYKVIYQANAVIEGLNSSNSITVNTKNQLMGEAMFVRAFAHFYLVNLFGDVPIITSTDYEQNSRKGREGVSLVYDQILKDLATAEELLSDNYVTVERIRPNRATVNALQARSYLFLEDWAKAEEYATKVISNTIYTLPSDLNQVFVKNSSETIWQLMPRSADGINGQVNEAYYFNPELVIYFNVLRKEFAQSFEKGDLRATYWIGYLPGDDTVYYPQKYRQYSPYAPLTEYSMVFRVSEQYLIRAEARANSDKITDAIEDLDAIRSRAGLPLIGVTEPGIAKSALLLRIENERKAELFSEWGHRWFDLKRTNRYDDILSNIKASWNEEDILYPVPQSEFDDNPNLGEQNPGY